MCPDFSTSAEGGSQALYKFSGSKSFRWDPGPSQQHRPRKPATGVLSSGLCIAGRPGAELLSPPPAPPASLGSPPRGLQGHLATLGSSAVASSIRHAIARNTRMAFCFVAAYRPKASPCVC